MKKCAGYFSMCLCKKYWYTFMLSIILKLIIIITFFVNLKYVV